MKKYLCILLVAVGFFLANSCSSGTKEGPGAASKENTVLYNRIPEGPAGDLLRNAIRKAGGWENWTSKKALRYVRVVTNYDSTGKQTETIRELHEYNLYPSFRARIAWESKGEQHLILCNNRQAWKLVNGDVKTDPKSKNAAWNQSFGSHYLIAIPFKLADEGANLTFEGDTILADGRNVTGIKVTYDEGAGTSALFHTWWFYFDTQTFEYVASLLRHDKGYGYNTYEDYTNIEGIRFYQQRFRSNSDSYDLARLKHSADYKLEGFKFVDRFPETHFIPPGKQ